MRERKKSDAQRKGGREGTRYPAHLPAMPRGEAAADGKYRCILHKLLSCTTFTCAFAWSCLADHECKPFKPKHINTRSLLWQRRPLRFPIVFCFETHKKTVSSSRPLPWRRKKKREVITQLTRKQVILNSMR